MKLLIGKFKDTLKLFNKVLYCIINKLIIINNKFIKKEMINLNLIKIIFKFLIVFY
jgi:hypothetical protein